MTTVKNATLPKVSIGIPTYNRSALLHRSIESALGQDYPNIEVLISDNASTDSTPDICRFYVNTCERRIKYVRQSVNLGATANFSNVLEMASGEFFMWLGDDDWIDPSYVTSCVRELLSDPTLALVGGSPRYYHNSLPTFNGRQCNMLQERWWLRILLYYVNVADNGILYGLMRTTQIRRIDLRNIMGGDWLIVAGLSSLGKLKTVPGTRIHRELGGATASYSQIARSLGLSNIQALFPMTSIAAGACLNIAVEGIVYHEKPVSARLALGSMVFCLILLKRFLGYGRSITAFIVRKIMPMG